MKDGIIKFSCHWQDKEFDTNGLSDLVIWRNKLYELGWIGTYPDGTGFGNISKRVGDGFVISSSQTSNVKEADFSHFSLVYGYDFQNNEVYCLGKRKASSETLTHAAIYDAMSDINCVIHIHNEKNWKRFIDILPTSSRDVEYGTIEMAYEIRSMANDKHFKVMNILIMGGHPDGIIAVGKSTRNAGENLLRHLEL